MATREPRVPASARAVSCSADDGPRRERPIVLRWSVVSSNHHAGFARLRAHDDGIPKAYCRTAGPLGQVYPIRIRIRGWAAAHDAQIAQVGPSFEGTVREPLTCSIGCVDLRHDCNCGLAALGEQRTPQRIFLIQRCEHADIRAFIGAAFRGVPFARGEHCGSGEPHGEGADEQCDHGDDGAAAAVLQVAPRQVQQRTRNRQFEHGNEQRAEHCAQHYDRDSAGADHTHSARDGAHDRAGEQAKNSSGAHARKRECPEGTMVRWECALTQEQRGPNRSRTHRRVGSEYEGRNDAGEDTEQNDAAIQRVDQHQRPLGGIEQMHELRSHRHRQNAAGERACEREQCGLAAQQREQIAPLVANCF